MQKKSSCWADGNGEFTHQVGLELDGSGFGLGTRSQRYAMLVDNGTVTHLNVEEGPGVDVSIRRDHDGAVVGSVPP